MNKQDLISDVADSANLTKAQAADAVNAVFDSITNALASKDDVRLVGFGTFSVRHREATSGHNPQTGAPMQIPASNQPKFKPGKALKDSVNS